MYARGAAEKPSTAHGGCRLAATVPHHGACPADARHRDFILAPRAPKYLIKLSTISDVLKDLNGVRSVRSGPSGQVRLVCTY